MWLKIFGISLITFLVIDFTWLLFIAKKLYNEQLGYLMKSEINFIAAFLFYIIFIVGLVFFVIEPALAGKGLNYAIFAGALFGLVTYATYDLTNLSTVKDWPLLITVIDLIWGSTVASLTATIGYLISKNFL